MHKSDWEESPPTEPNSPRLPDPVCGMLVEPRHSAGTRMNHGQSVFFCSSLCIEKFDANPEHYLEQSAHSPAGSEAARP